MGLALVLSGAGHAAEAQQCNPKTAGYFTQMAVSPRGTASPTDLAGIINSLTGSIGDPTRGSAVMADAGKGDCLACHRVPAIGGDTPQGDLGPNLSGVAVRYSGAQLRQIVVDPKVLMPNTVMPAYHKPSAFDRVPAKLIGKTVLSAGEVEDIVAFLKTLR